MSIEISNISKKFGDFIALNNVGLKIDSGELIAILGPSGSGKTTLLRIIAGLDFPDFGKIIFNGEDTVATSARERRVGFVFQHYAMFRHMTVFDNIAFGLKVMPRGVRPPNAKIRETVMSLLDMVQLSQFHDRYPSQLSGGQRQRVALARVLAINPRVLLLDEPFGALDAKVRKDLRRWLRKLHHEMKVTTVFVTHDQEEALELADRVVVMNHGVIEQVDTPANLYNKPANPFVYSFLGNINQLHGVVSKGVFSCGDVSFPVQAAENNKAIAFIRPYHIELAEPGRRENNAVIGSVNLAGPEVRIELELKNNKALNCSIRHEEYKANPLTKGASVSFRVKSAVIFDE